MNEPTIENLIYFAHCLWIAEPLDRPFMDFRVRVVGEGIDEGLNGERMDPRTRGYVGKELHIYPGSVDPERDIREGIQWVELRYHARHHAEEWDVLPIYDFVPSHLEPIDALEFPAEHSTWGMKQSYMIRRYRDMWVSHRFRLFMRDELEKALQERSWPPAQKFLELSDSLGEFEWPTKGQFDAEFPADIMKQDALIGRKPKEKK